MNDLLPVVVGICVRVAEARFNILNLNLIQR